MSAKEPNSPERVGSDKSLLVSCSVCLESVTDGGQRSIARLICGHHFHLDCIGSAFNAKGRMQCPNCRHVEEGLWLYGNGCFFHENRMDDFSFEDDTEIFGGTANLMVIREYGKRMVPKIQRSHMWAKQSLEALALLQDTRPLIADKFHIQSWAMHMLGHMPWCPHEGSYTQLAMEFGDLDDIGNRYTVNPSPAVSQGSGPGVGLRHVCPYIAARSLSTAGPSYWLQNFLGQHASMDSRRVASSSSRNYGLHQEASGAPVSNDVQTSFGDSYDHHSNLRYLQTSITRRHTLQNLQAIPTGSYHGLHLNLQSRQQMSAYNAQRFHPNAALHPLVIPWNGRRGWQSESLAHQMGTQVLLPERVWMIEPIQDYGSWMHPSTFGQDSNMIIQVDRIGGNRSRTYPWVGSLYLSQAMYGASNQWWVLTPHSNHP